MRLGYEGISITDPSAERGMRMAKELQRINFKTKIRYIPPSLLINLPGTHTVMVNTTPMTSDNELLKDLSYFNFLTKSGVVIDLTITPVTTPLLAEAMGIGASVVPGFSIAARRDCVWSNRCLKTTIDVADYTEKFKVYLEKLFPS